MVQKECNWKLRLRQQKAVIRLFNFFKTPICDNLRVMGLFIALDSQDLCFTAQSERNPAFEKGHLFSRTWWTIGCGYGLLTSGTAVLAAALSSGYQWCFLNAVQPQGSVKSLNTWTVTVKKQQEQTCHFVKYISRWRHFWGAEQLLKLSVPLES